MTSVAFAVDRALAALSLPVVAPELDTEHMPSAESQRAYAVHYARTATGLEADREGVWPEALQLNPYDVRVANALHQQVRAALSLQGIVLHG